MAPTEKSPAPYPQGSITRVLSVVIERHSANLLVLLVCAGMIGAGIYSFDRIILPMSRANQDARDGIHSRTVILQDTAATLERSIDAAERTATIQQETTRQLIELTRIITAERSRQP